MSEVVSELDGGDMVEILANGIPDHISWVILGGSNDAQNIEFRVPKVPQLLANGDYTVAPGGSVGYVCKSLLSHWRQVTVKTKIHKIDFLGK